MRRGRVIAILLDCAGANPISKVIQPMVAGITGRRPDLAPSLRLWYQAVRVCWSNHLTFATATAYRLGDPSDHFWGFSCQLSSLSTWLTCDFRRPSTVTVRMP